MSVVIIHSQYFHIRYNAAGDYQELPQLNTPRSLHACGSYRDGDTEVRLSCEVRTLISHYMSRYC